MADLVPSAYMQRMRETIYLSSLVDSAVRQIEYVV